MPVAKIDRSLDMYYEDDGFTDPWTTSEVVVLQHGMFKSGRLLYAWVPPLARHYRVIRPDARGMGKSTVPPRGYPWSLRGFAQDLKALIEHLQVERVHLIGESLGGSIALRFACEYPERLRSVTVCGFPPYRFGLSFFKELVSLVEREGVGAWVRKSMLQRLDSPQAGTGQVDWYERQLASTPKHVVVEALQGLAKEDMSAMLPIIRLPALAIVGGATRPDAGVTSPEEMQALIPHLRVETIPGASGYIQWNHPEQCVEIWRRFVKGLS